MGLNDNGEEWTITNERPTPCIFNLAGSVSSLSLGFNIYICHVGQISTWSPCRPNGLNKAPNPPN